MKYRHDTVQSAEYLRLAVKRMAQQAAGLHPASYAIWYEYVAGINPDLRSAIDAYLQRGERLDDRTTYALYAKYVSALDAQTAQRIGDNVTQLVDQVSASAVEAGNQASRFGDSLERWSGELLEPPGPRSQFSLGVEDILRGTREMQSAITTLQERLEQSTREAQQLRNDVARAREEALLDPLTGLTNRRGFDLAIAAAAKEVEAGATPGPCLLMIDLDSFKRLNDTYGHPFGDRVLIKVAEILRANVKGKDTAARYGGEEFAVLLPQTPRGGAVGLAEALRAMVASSRVRQNGKNETWVGNFTVSIGVADLVPGESAADLVARADRALYTAKTQGRNRVQLATRPTPVPTTD
ncbi:MAG TPA: GGDEF domain-containing protein [Accumulibacter sp.]|uniref:GGDEF domain-containing protein n=1 Tax=Accumulibacter sp. TaxID=2053492 RepID=UPI002624C8C2|nr:GGDEF domain-containing protein [Accumulibacter sp.]HMV06729.1 GGDEF domain-containing protein [Accumulibacter sp.]HMW80404.1 GGDEF domain-containing protein [Accumulibacter sp.]HMX69633.1 GGDEF domain-containing protein [Accumulibacter sp.]HND39062.1 GGDEF domain-containing protein [Accumulibacter sp.]HNE38745.1 GGDEF domain-containing protein [Accumulibacter sp.]